MCKSESLSALRSTFVPVAITIVGLVLGLGLFTIVKGPGELLLIYSQLRYNPNSLTVDNHIPDPVVGYINKPRLDYERTVAGRSVPVHTDADGARIAEEQPVVFAKQHDMPPIMVIGGSQTFGWGVFEEETFGAIVASGLGRDVRNFGISGLGTISSVLVAERHLNEPGTIVVYGFWQDHLNRNLRPCVNSHVRFCIAQPFMDWTAPERPSVAFAFDPMKSARLGQEYDGLDEQGQKANKWQQLSAHRDALIAHHFSDPESAHMVQRKSKTAAMLLERLENSVKKKGGELIVVYIANYLNPDKMEALPSDLRDQLLKAGIHFIDMYPYFRARLNVGESLSLLGDGHMNPSTHRLVGESILKYVQVKGIAGIQ